ncbi:DNA primase DnaG [Halorubrum sp. SY-15]|uniref:DNA primase DnaG n=1 Tax=Halorubrum sp. SY-15 TaxID=3402277 RepID=UPI003EBE64CA
MNDTAKYLIRATIAADGVVERSDVVGAVFGQTEGLLGDELDLRDLQESSRVGRIDVSIRSENGQSFGEVTVASSLDKVETAILAASLETIDRIGPCGAAVEVTSIEDVRAAKRREVVERAKELVASGFEETSLGSDDVLEEVREAARVAGIVDYEGLPAGPRVGDSDAVIVVEGRADVSTLLECGIKNAVAVEGTNVPDAVADLTTSRTVTAFLDGDRGGELILRELAQVGDVEYVAFAPPGESVEDLDRATVFDALRGKVPYETLADEPNLREAAGGGATPAADAEVIVDAAEVTGPPEAAARDAPTDASSDVDDTDDASGDGDGTDGDSESTGTDSEPTDDDAVPDAENTAGGDGDAGGTGDAAAAVDRTPRSFEEHVQEVVDGDSGRARLLDDDLGVLTEVEATDAFDAVEGAADPPMAVVLDGTVDQRLVDVAAQRGVGTLFGRDAGDLVKRPVGTRIVTVADRAVEA